MRSSESVGVYELRLVNVDSRSSRCHVHVYTYTHTHTYLKGRGFSFQPPFLSPSLPIRTRSLLRSFFSPFSPPLHLSILFRFAATLPSTYIHTRQV